MPPSLLTTTTSQLSYVCVPQVISIKLEDIVDLPTVP